MALVGIVILARWCLYNCWPETEVVFLRMWKMYVRKWYRDFRRAVKQVVEREVVRLINPSRGYWRPRSNGQGFKMMERGDQVWGC